MAQMMTRPRLSDAARFSVEARQRVARLREGFLVGDELRSADIVAPEIISSWSRSRGLGVDPEHATLPAVVLRSGAAHRLADTAEPIMQALAQQCRDSDAWGMLLDRECVQVAPIVGDEAIVREGLERGGGVGAMFSEERVGTNGAGISLERLEPFMVVAEEHYRTSEHSLVSVGVPLRDGFGRMAGFLLMCQRMRNANHMIVPYAQSIARAIDEQIALTADGDERALFEAYSRQSRRPSLAVMGLSETVFVANTAAQQLLRDPAENDALRHAILDVSAGGRSRLLTLRLGEDRFRVHCRVVELSRGRYGAVASFSRAPEAPTIAVGSPSKAAGDPLVRAHSLGLPTLVIGEVGSGRAHRVTSMATCRQIDAASAAADPSVWLARLGALADSGSVLIRHLDALPSPLLQPVLENVRSASGWVAATATTAPEGADTDFPVTVEVAPLRERAREMPTIVADLLADLGAPDVTCSPEVMSMLAWHSWPGNIAQLRRVLAGALVVMTGTVITIGDLPREIATSGRRQGGGLLARTERELVFEALRASNWNRDVAAQTLGVSRATMYRRIRQFGFQLPSSR
jgi:transcriptional regulator of acetoin/glycerol metabolism